MDQTVNLKQFRKRYNLTQTKAAESIEIDQRQWNRYENGINEFPLRYLKQLCTVHNVSADELLQLHPGNTLAGDRLYRELHELAIWMSEQQYITAEAEGILREKIDRLFEESKYKEREAVK